MKRRRQQDGESFWLLDVSDLLDVDDIFGCDDLLNPKYRRRRK